MFEGENFTARDVRTIARAFRLLAVAARENAYKQQITAERDLLHKEAETWEKAASIIERTRIVESAPREGLQRVKGFRR